MNITEAVRDSYDKNIILIKRYREGDREAGEELAILNRPLVYKLAGKMTGRGVSLEELVETGNIGLVKAINTFDLERECAFSTYAVPLIFGEMRRFLRDDGPVKVSRESKRLSALLNAERDRRRTLGEDASLGAVAEAVGVSREDAAMALFAGAQPRSLDEPVFDEEDGVTLGAVISDEDGEARDFDRLSLHLALERLSDFERRLIILRYFRDLSQARCAEILGLSQVKVSRCEKKILARLGELMQ